MRIRWAASTDVGRVRDHNEDAYLTGDPLFAVADGMGGHQAGEVAARVAIDTLADAAPQAPGGAERELPDAIRRANQTILEQASGDPSLEGMGTTLTVLLAGSDRIHLAHVGDSRAYLFRDGELRMLTEDHTLVQRMVREGRLTPAEAEIHPQRSILTRALGVEGDLEVDQASHEVHPGDRLLLCSDGLSSMVPDREIRRVLDEVADPKMACDALVEAANQAGGFDNVTVVVVDLLEGEEEPPEEEGRRRRRGGRALLWLAVSLVVLAGGLLGARNYVLRQWYVGIHEEHVALYRGIPTEVLGFSLSTLEEETDLPADAVRRIATWAELDDGITADSEAEAREIIRQIEDDLRSGMVMPS